MYLVAAAAFFAIFIVNVTIGAFGGTQFLGDVGEMLVLLAASVIFVVAILRLEASAKMNRKSRQPLGGNNGS